MDAERLLSHLIETPSREFSRAAKSRTENSHWWSRRSRFAWLLLAVGVSWLSWAAPAEAQPACAHDICEFGVNLNPVCDPCVDDICNGPGGGDPYCCDVEWDDNCIDQVLPVCGDPSCAAACGHSPCETGDPLDSTCNSCAAAVCFADSSCCSTDWSQSCVDMVSSVCGYTCSPGDNVCSDALLYSDPIPPGEYFGTLIGSSNDGCESGQNSCRAGDVWYKYTQGPAEDMVLSTCATQRSFGIDTVLSVHTGCPGKQNNEIVSNDDHFLGYVPQACVLDPSPINLDAGVPLGASFALDPGETVMIRVAHHNESAKNPFEFRLLPEPDAWMALVAGAGALGALSRRRARG